MTEDVPVPVDFRAEACLRVSKVCSDIHRVTERRKTKQRMGMLRSQLEKAQEDFYSFRFKYKLLVQLANGEQVAQASALN